MEMVNIIKPKARGRKKLTGFQLKLLLLIMPFMLFIVAFSYIPILGWSMAFVDYSPGMNVFKCAFVGFTNFVKIFNSTSDFPQVMLNTLVMSFLGIALSPLPAILAIMLMEIRLKAFRRVLQTISSLPNFISWVIVYGIALTFFSRDDGLINHILVGAGLIKDPLNVLGNNDIVWYFQTALGIWKGTGWTAIIYLGAIAGIDSELYEAAQVDGAGRMQQIVHITVPGLIPTFVIMLLLSVGALLSGTSFEQIYCFNNPLVLEHIQTLDLYVYFQGIGHLNYSYSTAVGIFKTVISVLLLFGCNAFSRKAAGYSII